MLVVVSNSVLAVKLCSNKMLQFLTGWGRRVGCQLAQVDVCNGCKMVVVTSDVVDTECHIVSV